MKLIGLGTGRVAITAISAMLAAGEARAVNGAYAVDAADISEVGSGKVESWMSAASNSDFAAVANPSCAVNIFRPVELNLQTVAFWITIGTTIRFPAPEQWPARERTGHL